MGGFFGVASNGDCSLDLFFGVDYHSHLGTRRGGLAVFSEDGKFARSIHNIQNSPFRTKFEKDIEEYGVTLEQCMEDHKARAVVNVNYMQDWADNYQYKGNDRYQKRLF